MKRPFKPATVIGTAGIAKLSTRQLVVHGFSADTDKLRRRVRDEHSFQKYLRAVTRTACGREVYGREPMVIARGKAVTCTACRKKGVE